MILIFDLDDTLYDEASYVRSGFRAVARWGEERFGQDAHDSFVELEAILRRDGRGQVFDTWLRGRASVREAVRVYRHHDPDIALPQSSREVLDAVAAYPLYLVTDGHKVVQARKIEALGIGGRFRHCYVTHRYGRSSAKPSPRCFELIKAREHAEWDELVHVGDDPAKDFVTLNRLGAHTIRVLTGRHAIVRGDSEHEAHHQAATLLEVPAMIEQL